jgi:hypothetical protein
MPSPQAADLSEDLVSAILAFAADPLRYVIYAFPWGKGELKDHKGPRAWQREFLVHLGEQLRAGKSNAHKAILEAVSSGHGVGKSALVSWLILWSLSTHEDTRGVVTANTENQLKAKTWAELSKWHRLAINARWFNCTATAIYSVDPRHERTWRFDMVPWSEHKTEAFAGLHNQGRRLVLIFDEASAIPDKIWEVSEGALTDENTEILWCVYGNPTRNTGRFKECFGKRKHRWHGSQIDSEHVEGTNKEQIQKWITDYGEDSDFVRVRVRGMFPLASSLQLISSDTVAEAMRREARSNIGDPLVMALDIARGGDDNCVFRFRRGLDARSIKPVRIPGSEVRDSMRLVGKAADLIEQYKPDMFFYDGTGVGGPVGDRIAQLGHPVFEVQFGSASPDGRAANMRAYMYLKMREWLQKGGAIDADSVLEIDLTSVEYTHNKRDQIILESKESMKSRGLASPDDGDALAMTFAYTVAPTFGPGALTGDKGKLLHEYDPYAPDRD